MRGTGGVPFGDRSVGGVIQHHHRQIRRPRASAGLTLGSGYRRVDVSAAGSADATYFNIFANYAGVNGWRKNTRATSVPSPAGSGIPRRRARSLRRRGRLR